MVNYKQTAIDLYSALGPSIDLRERMSGEVISYVDQLLGIIIGMAFVNQTTSEQLQEIAVILGRHQAEQIINTKPATERTEVANKKRARQLG